MIGCQGIGKKTFKNAWLSAEKSSCKKVSDYNQITIADINYSIDFQILNPSNDINNTFDDIKVRL